MAFNPLLPPPEVAEALKESEPPLQTEPDPAIETVGNGLIAATAVLVALQPNEYVITQVYVPVFAPVKLFTIGF